MLFGGLVPQSLCPKPFTGKRGRLRPCASQIFGPHRSIPWSVLRVGPPLTGHPLLQARSSSMETPLGSAKQSSFFSMGGGIVLFS